MTQVAERQEVFAAPFEALRREPAFEAGGLAPLRQAAFDRVLRRGLPTTRDEEWRFTNIGPIASLQAERAASPSVTRAAVAPFRFEGTSATLVVINGRFAPALSDLDALPAGVSVRSLADGFTPGALERTPPAGGTVFIDLNTALFEDALVIEIAPRAIVSEPLHVLFVGVPGPQPAIVSTRLRVTAGEQAQAAILETYVDLDARGAALFTNAVTEVQAAPDAILDHVKLQAQGETSFHLASMIAHLQRHSTVTSHSLTLGARIARNDIIAVLDGEGAECTLQGLYVGSGDRLIDNHTTIDHARAQCPSHEIYKGILTGRARAVFNGKIVVRPDAQKTDAKQTNKALLLTDEAQINTKPQLEIFADDVKCTHGAAIGQLDEDALFYLRARGIADRDARNLLIHAFAGDVLTGVKLASVRSAAMALVEETLAITGIEEAAQT
jgi:Fe-S cluster assembly protein SufD